MQPSRPEPEPVLVIGVGNAYRGDDAAGLVVAEHLSAVAPPGVEVIGHAGDPVSLMQSWDRRRRVYLVDAVVAGGEPGSVYRFDPVADPLDTRFGRRGTHGAGVAEATELARALGCLPPCLTGYGIEGGSFTTGAGLSPAVRRAVTVVCERLLRELGQAVDAG
jgi:hydrogenase maturation protease